MTRRSAIGALLLARGTAEEKTSFKALCRYRSSSLRATSPESGRLAFLCKPRASNAWRKGVNLRCLVQFASPVQDCGLKEVEIEGTHFEAVFDATGTQLYLVTVTISAGLQFAFWIVDVDKMTVTKVRDLTKGTESYVYPLRDGRLLVQKPGSPKRPAPVRMGIFNPKDDLEEFLSKPWTEVSEGERSFARSILSADSKLIAYPMSRTRFGLRATENLSLLWEASASEGLLVREIALSDDSRFVLASLVDSLVVDDVKRHVLRVYSAEDGKTLWGFEAPPADIVALAPGGRRLALGRRVTDRFGKLSQLVELYEEGRSLPIASTIIRSVWRPSTIMETLYEGLAFAAKGTSLVVTAKGTRIYQLSGLGL